MSWTERGDKPPERTTVDGAGVGGVGDGVHEVCGTDYVAPKSLELVDAHALLRPGEGLREARG